MQTGFCREDYSIRLTALFTKKLSTRVISTSMMIRAFVFLQGAKQSKGEMNLFMRHTFFGYTSFRQHLPPHCCLIGRQIIL